MIYIIYLNFIYKLLIKNYFFFFFFFFKKKKKRLGNKEIIKRLSVGKVTKFIDEFYGIGSPLEQWNKILPNVHLKLRLKFKSPGN